MSFEKEAGCAPEPFWTDIIHFWRVHISSVALWNYCSQLILAFFPRIKAKEKKKISKLTGQRHLVPKIRKPEATVSLPVVCSKHVVYLSSEQFFMFSMVKFNNLYKGSYCIHFHHGWPPCNTPPVVSGKASIWRHTLCSCYWCRHHSLPPSNRYLYTSSTDLQFLVTEVYESFCHWF